MRLSYKVTLPDAGRGCGRDFSVDEWDDLLGEEMQAIMVIGNVLDIGDHIVRPGVHTRLNLLGDLLWRPHLNRVAIVVIGRANSRTRFLGRRLRIPRRA